MTSIQVKFKSAVEKYKITEEPMMVPLEITKEGLQELVNHFLNLQDQVQFQFTINSSLLHNSLEELVKDQELSTEDIHTIEYLPLLMKPQPQHSFEQDDWISSISVRDKYVFTACYDYEVYVWDLESGEKITSHPVHSSAVKCLDTRADSAGSVLILTGSLDRKITLSKFENSTISILKTFQELDSTVCSIKFSPSGDFFAAGSFSGMIYFYNLLQDESFKETGSKRLKTENADIKPVYKNDFHKDSVPCILFKDEETLVSAGADKAIQIFDLRTRTTLQTVSTDSAIMGLDYYEDMLVSSHSDTQLCVWNISDLSLKSKIRTSDRFNSCVQWMRNDTNTFVVGTYSGAIRMFDVRVKESLMTIREPSPKSKVFALALLENKIIFGGEDNKLHILSTK